MQAARLACIGVLSLGVLWGEPLDSIFVVEMSPGTEQAIDRIRPGDLEEDDRAGVVGFFKTAYLLQPLTENRDDLGEALQRASMRAGVAIGGPDRGQLESNFTIDLVEALKKACAEFESRGGTGRRRAIVVLFAGEDPKLGFRLDAVRAALGASNARLYAVVVPRVNASHVPAITPRGTTPWPVPSAVMTSRRMSQLAEESGGRMFPRNWDLKKILAQARKP